MERFIPFTTNSLGYRGKEIPPKSEKFRILCLGDSFLMGKDVADEETLPVHLENLLEGQAEVLNAGCGGWNTTQEYYDFQERGFALKPDLVLLFYVFNDAHYRKKMSPWRRVKESIVLHSAFYRYLLTRWIQFEAGWQAQVQLVGEKEEEGNLAVQEAKMMNWNEDFQDGSKGWEESQRSLRRLKERCQSVQIPFKIVLFPYLVQLDEHYPFHAVHEALQKFCHQEEIPFLDLFPYYKGRSTLDLWVGQKDSHPNATGQKIAAEAVYQEFFKKTLFQKKE
jgi:lysophospholipase L1-like esterase